MQPMAYSTPADNPIVTEAQTPTRFLRTDIFSLFSPSQNMAKKERKNIIHLSKSYFRRRRVYRTISFFLFFLGFSMATSTAKQSFGQS